MTSKERVKSLSSVRMINYTARHEKDCLKITRANRPTVESIREKMKRLLLPVIVILSSCSNERHTDVGQYVYVDAWCVIHVDKDCAEQSNEKCKTKDERMLANRGIHFSDTCALGTYGKNIYGVLTELRFCPRCIDDKTYRHLTTIMVRNDIKSQAY